MYRTDRVHYNIFQCAIGMKWHWVADFVTPMASCQPWVGTQRDGQQIFYKWNGMKLSLYLASRTCVHKHSSQTSHIFRMTHRMVTTGILRFDQNLSPETGLCRAHGNSGKRLWGHESSVWNMPLSRAVLGAVISLDFQPRWMPSGEQPNTSSWKARLLPK